MWSISDILGWVVRNIETNIYRLVNEENLHLVSYIVVSVRTTVEELATSVCVSRLPEASRRVNLI